MNSSSVVDSELLDLLYLDDVEGAVLFRTDGSVIGAAYGDNYSQALLRVLQWTKGNIEKVSAEMKGNNLQKVTYELADANILFFAVNSTVILTTLANKTANLSLLAVESKRKSHILSKFL